MFDLIVIGSGPAGESGAFEATRLGMSVALIDSRMELGGNSCHTGTLPSKTLRESSLVLSHALDTEFRLPPGPPADHPITMEDFISRARMVMTQESAQVRTRMERRGITVFIGKAALVDPHTVRCSPSTGAPTLLTGKTILIACGSRPQHPSTEPFDGQHLFDSDELLTLKRLPKSLIVLGGGVIGSEYATIFSNLGISVQLVDAHPIHLPFVDQEIITYLHREIAKRPLILNFGVRIANIAVSGEEAVVSLEDGRVLRAEAALYALGRVSNADSLDVSKVGISLNQHGNIIVDLTYRTNVPHIAAAGDVIGFPALASTSWDQGRSAVRGLFGQHSSHPQTLLPYGIYTIPEISTVGMSEVDAQKAGVATVIGRCDIGEIARGIISGDNGLLKLVFDRSTRALLGAHCICARATDIIHITMMCMHLHGTLEDLTETVFNYPTISDAIKVAALDALWQLESHQSG